MRVLVGLIVAVLALQPGGPRSAIAGAVDPGATPMAGASPGNVLHGVYDPEVGGYRPELVVVAPDGTERRRVRVPVTAIARIGGRAWGDRVLVKEVAGPFFLVDAGGGTVRELPLPVELRDDLILGSPVAHGFEGTRWTVLSDARQSVAFLVDLETAAVVDLVAPVGDAARSVFVGSAVLAPGGERLLFYTGRDTWLIPTANPERARRLGGDGETFGATFSPDGGRIVFGRLTGAGDVEIVVGGVDGTGTIVVASDRGALSARFVPNRDALLLVYPDRVALRSLADRRERRLLAFTGQPGGLQPAPSGRGALFGYETADDDQVWFHLDLETGTAAPLAALGELAAALSPEPQRWVLFFAPGFVASGSTTVRGVDLETGVVDPLVTLAEPGLVRPEPPIGDGRVRLIAAIDSKRAQLWLLDLGRGDARLLAEGDAVHGALSPDARWVAVSIAIDGEAGEIALWATAGGEPMALGEGFFGVWVGG